MSKDKQPHEDCEHGNCREHRHSECLKQNHSNNAEMDRIDFITQEVYGHVIERDLLINYLKVYDAKSNRR